LAEEAREEVPPLSTIAVTVMSVNAEVGAEEVVV
jgi:hypothetical protein